MKKSLVLIMWFCMAMISHAQNQGIQFFQGSWNEAVEQAKKENKLIFVDFYTQWCGPCYNMAKEVFIRQDVGNCYNEHFINVKIDAEDGEGIELAKKYKVRSYPTYAFIDPATEELVHRSSSRQSAEQFIYTAESAITPHLRSFYLDEEYNKGNRERDFLFNYITYKRTVYANKDVLNAFDELLKQVSLTEKPVWDLYVSSVSGLNAYTRYISDHYQEFCEKLGKDVVDAKLKADTQYGDLSIIESLCDYQGKSFNCAMIRVNNCLNKGEYDQVAVLIDSLLVDSKTNQQDLMERLKFIARVSYRRDAYPVSWFLKCMEYLQYVAYNYKERDDVSIHQEYAAALEILIRKMKNGECDAPHHIIDKPAHGKTIYNMRPDGLKQKPKAKPKK